MQSSRFTTSRHSRSLLNTHMLPRPVNNIVLKPLQLRL